MPSNTPSEEDRNARFQYWKDTVVKFSQNEKLNLNNSRIDLFAGDMTRHYYLLRNKIHKIVDGEKYNRAKIIGAMECLIAKFLYIKPDNAFKDNIIQINARFAVFLGVTVLHTWEEPYCKENNSSSQCPVGMKSKMPSGEDGNECWNFKDNLYEDSGNPCPFLISNKFIDNRREWLAKILTLRIKGQRKIYPEDVVEASFFWENLQTLFLLHEA